jgi:hypothetical protein
VDAEGLTHQIHVAPQHRRRGIAGKPAQAAFAVQHARGLPDLHADGSRTDLGERFAQGLRRLHRLAARPLDAPGCPR